jgi:hypothetical protein
LKQLAILLTISILFIGCGASDPSTSKKDFWEYRTPSNDINKTYSYKEYDLNNIETNNVAAAFSETETKLDNSLTVTSSSGSTIYTVDSFTIYKNDKVLYSRHVKIGDNLSDDCIYYKHYEEYLSYNDVMQIKCSNSYFNYSAEQGYIGQVAVNATYKSLLYLTPKENIDINISTLF